jgi:LAGLIDADG-like domain
MISYLAGFFDGEGTVAVYKQNTKTSKNSYFLYVSISQRKTRDSMKIARYLLGNFGGSYYEWTTKSKSCMWSWQVSRDEAVPFLKKIYRHLFIKKQQVSIALKWQANKIRLKSGPKSKGEQKEVVYYLLRTRQAVDKLNRLKRC